LIAIKVLLEFHGRRGSSEYVANLVLLVLSLVGWRLLCQKAFVFNNIIAQVQRGNFLYLKPMSLKGLALLAGITMHLFLLFINVVQIGFMESRPLANKISKEADAEQ
jgi:hypothetical protein